MVAYGKCKCGLTPVSTRDHSPASAVGIVIMRTFFCKSVCHSTFLATIQFNLYICDTVLHDCDLSCKTSISSLDKSLFTQISLFPTLGKSVS